MVELLAGQSKRRVKSILLRSGSAELLNVIPKSKASISNNVQAKIKRANFETEWDHLRYGKEDFFLFSQGKNFCYGFEYRSFPLVFIVVDSSLSEDELHLLILAKNFILQEYRSVTFEKMVDSFSGEITSARNALDLQLAPSDVASTIFGVDHIFSLDDGNTVSLDLISSITFSGSPVAKFVESAAGSKFFAGSSSRGAFQRCDLNAAGRVSVSPPSSTISETKTSKSTFFWMRRVVGSVNKSLVYAWDNSAQLSPGDRASLEFLMSIHLSQLHLLDDAEVQLEQARNFGQFEQSRRIGDSFRSIRHALDRKTQAAVSGVQLVRGALSALESQRGVGRIDSTLSEVEESLAVASQTVKAMSGVGVFMGDVQPETLRVRDIRKDVLGFFKGTFRQSKVEFSFTGYLDGKFTVYRNWIIQIFANLIGNSIDLFDERETVARTISISVRKRSAGGVIFVYKDTAGGFRMYPDKGGDWRLMEPDEIERSFKKNESFRAGRSSDGEHLRGFGLWIVKEYLDLHNGNIEVVHNDSSGVEFHVTVGAAPKKTTI
ncbi:MAG: HAMP domain-containing sensor histidine kinase [Pseudomonadota bacterium]